MNQIHISSLSVICILFWILAFNKTFVLEILCLYAQ